MSVSNTDKCQCCSAMKKCLTGSVYRRRLQPIFPGCVAAPATNDGGMIKGIGKMKLRKVSQLATASVCTLALSFATIGIANAVETVNPPSWMVAVQEARCGFKVPVGYSLEQADSELIALEQLPENLQDEEILKGLGLVQSQERIAPVVIVAAIACAVGVGGAIFNTTWSSAYSVAWSLAGVLVSCIPGTSQAKLVSVILKHKGVIAKALKAVGASAAAAALLKGDSAQ